MIKRLPGRITADPAVCFGKPCIKGTRIWISLILEHLASGMTHQEILSEYPQIEEEDIRAALTYAAIMTHKRFVELANEFGLDENLGTSSPE